MISCPKAYSVSAKLFRVRKNISCLKNYFVSDKVFLNISNLQNLYLISPKCNVNVKTYC